MAAKQQNTINLAVWKDTGETFEDRKIYRSILGHYALGINNEFLKALPEGALAKIEEKGI